MIFYSKTFDATLNVIHSKGEAQEEFSVKNK
jgi:hypothetical protein